MNSYKLLFFLLSFCISDASAQITTLQISSKQLPIPYVTLIDSVRGIVGASDSLGSVKLKKGNYYLTLSHVSFKELKLFIPNPTKDTIVKIEMGLKSLLLDDFRVISEKINKKRFFEIGNYNHRTSSNFLVRENTMMGIKILNFYHSGEPSKYLRSIKFKLNKFKIEEKDFILEFKIFKFNEYGNLDAEPLNSIPIYVKASELKNRNEIMIDENIKFPENDLLVSLELPEVFDKHYDWTIPFVGDFNGDVASTFVMRNKDGKWNDEYLRKCGLKLENSNYFVLNFSLTYWNGLQKGLPHQKL